MNQPDDELSLDEVEAILAQPQRTTRNKPDGERTTLTWFKVPHTGERNCEVSKHDESARPRNKGMTTIINDVAVCRICYLAGLDRE